ncbi:hypothetical protein F1D05_26070 [Kribbella qitaiheensis]|uniref:Uncharacterized protein n=1 Tax=Kribbella qitaiheensis TaxID=1544730 RepID=A0A7G6X3C9_9ACTN|nr:hypothetical protein [Kribbella qitaiheensis]QNE20744.1 hypothetical protein F1D05_26070 [Kribbella qitaiheensis]
MKPWPSVTPTDTRYFAPSAARGRQLRAVELSSGESEHGRDAGDAVRQVRHLGEGPVGHEAGGDERPVGSTGRGLGLGQQDVRGPVGQLASLLHAMPQRPQGPQQDSAGAEREVVQPRAGESPWRLDDGLWPAVRLGEFRQPP